LIDLSIQSFINNSICLLIHSSIYLFIQSVTGRLHSLVECFAVQLVVDCSMSIADAVHCVSVRTRWHWLSWRAMFTWRCRLWSRPNFLIRYDSVLVCSDIM